MFLKKIFKKKFNFINYYNYKFLIKFINNDGSIFFKKKYKNFNYFKNKAKRNIKRLRFLSLLPYSFKHFYRKKDLC